MEKVQLLITGLCAFLFISDILNAFNPPPGKPHHHAHHAHHAHSEDSIPIPKEVLKHTDFKPHESLDGGGAGIGAGIGAGAVVQISFCTSCSYKGMALTMKKMLESAFPGVDVELSNYPPPLPKRMLSKFVPVLQIGSIVLITAGDHIFPRLGYTVPPPWYYSLKQKRFGVIATTWLLGNALQSFLQGTGAFEVMCNGDLVFSKLRENRFPGEYELRELVGRSLGAKY